MPTAEQLNDLRRKVLEGEDVSREQLHRAIDTLVGGRLAAHEAEASKPKRKAKAQPLDLSDMF